MSTTFEERIPWYREICDYNEVVNKPGAQIFDDIKVIDLSYANLSGDYTGTFLAEFGAEAIRVEPPEGDPFRAISRLGFIDANRNKFHITLNIQKDDGKDVFKKMAARADVLIETYKPGFLDTLGIGYRQLSQVNPRLIYVALCNYGQYGPLAKTTRPSSDIISQAMSGITYETGEVPEPGIPEEDQPWAVPTKQNCFLAWTGAAYFAFIGITSALWWRMKTGKGQFIDVSPWEAARFGVPSIGYCYHTKYVKERIGTLDPVFQLYGFIKARDGYIFAGAFSDRSWESFCDMAGRPDLKEKYLAGADRIKDALELGKECEEYTKQFTVDEIRAKSLEWSKTHPAVVAGGVNTPMETYRDEGYFEETTLIKFRDPIHGEICISRGAPKSSGPVQKIKWLARPIGSDNEFVYSDWLGLTKGDLEVLRNMGVI